MLIDAIKRRLRLRRIEKAIGMKMNKWQRKFVLDPNCEHPMPGCRASGKTVAACVWMLLNVKKPVRINSVLYKTDPHSARYYRIDHGRAECCQVPDPDIWISKRAATHTVRTLLEMREKCKAIGIEVFDIC